MKTMSRLFTLFLLLLWPTLAQLAFTLDSPTQSGAPGSTLTYSGTLTNTGASLLFLSGDNFTLAGTGLTLDDSPFLLGAPLSLAAMDTYSGDFFTVQMDMSAPLQSVDGLFTILGGPDDGDQDTLGTRPFSVTVVPEPGTMGFVAALSLGASGLIRRRNRQSAGRRI